MNSRLTVVCHLWPSLSPWNVWQLTLSQWVMFAANADAWIKAREAQQQRGR